MMKVDFKTKDKERMEMWLKFLGITQAEMVGVLVSIGMDTLENEFKLLEEDVDTFGLDSFSLNFTKEKARRGKFYKTWYCHHPRPFAKEYKSFYEWYKKDNKRFR